MYTFTWKGLFMKRNLLSLLASVAFFSATFASTTTSADDAKPLTKADVEAIVKQVIKDNPDFVLQTLVNYEKREDLAKMAKMALNVKKMQGKIKDDPRAPVIGNPNGDVTVVEFFDYHCGYCKRFMPEITQLLQDDKNVRVVFKEFPILREDSETAARAALAVNQIDKSKYLDYHILLMKTNDDFTDEVLAGRAKQIGIDPDAFKKAFNDPELKKDLANNKALADSVGITGTPGLIIGTQVLPGAVGYDKLKSTIASVRDSQNQQKSVPEDDKKDD
jgi:protein-disulfide isomerase